MKRTLKAAIAAIGLTVTATVGMAADWTPPGPIKLMIAFRAGGGADTQARLIAEALEEKMGWNRIHIYLIQSWGYHFFFCYL